MKEIIVIHEVRTQVDDDVYEYLSQFKWMLSPREKHVVRYQDNGDGKKTIYMHREILGLGKDDGSETDHVDRDRMNNQKHNLRRCTTAQNQWNAKKRKDNKSGYRGVYIHKNSFVAMVYCHTKAYRAGSFKTAEEAARARDRKAIELYGEFAYTNFPREEYEVRP